MALVRKVLKIRERGTPRIRSLFSLIFATAPHGVFGGGSLFLNVAFEGGACKCRKKKNA